jgi:hypothetical protein
MALAILFIIALVVGGAGYWLTNPGHQRPPSIFDSAVDDVFSFMANDGFNKLSLEERLTMLQQLAQRMSGMSQGESVAASAFMAGLTGPMSEQMVNNARILGKDIFVQGADEYFALKSDAERAAYLDQWLIRWIRFGEQATGRKSKRSDAEILSRMSDDARKDVQRVGTIDAKMAQQIADFWERDIENVSSPLEKAKICQFGPALRQHILSRGQREKTR